MTKRTLRIQITRVRSTSRAGDGRVAVQDPSTPSGVLAARLEELIRAAERGEVVLPVLPEPRQDVPGRRP